MSQQNRKTSRSTAKKKRPVYRDYLGRLDIGSSYSPEFDPVETEHIANEQRAWAASLFNDRILADLIDRFHIIGDSNVATLTEFLRESARFYVHHKNYLNEGPTIIEHRQRFQKVRAAAMELKDAIASLTDEEKAVLWLPLQDRKLEYFNEQTGKTEVVPNYINAFSDDGTSVVITPPMGLVIEAARIISNFANKALDGLPNDVGGRPPTSPPVVLWIRSAKCFFEQGLNRKFTFDSQKGAGITPAFDFCCAVLKILDPTVDQTSIGTAMRSVIRSNSKNGRRRKARKNPKR